MPKSPFLLWPALLAGLAAQSTLAAESCGAWIMADADPSDGRYLMVVQARACDLTGGVSAFVQFRNEGAERLKLAYRVKVDDSAPKPKEGEVTLEPGQLLRGPTCQQCSSRKGGIKAWEILSIEVLPGAPAVTVPTAAETSTAPPPVVTAPAPEPAQPVPAPPPAVPSPKPAPTPAAVKPAGPPAPAAAKEPVDGLVTEDGTVIPWDQLPPEFRPKK